MDIQKIPIYCINLDKRPERLSFFMNQPGVRELKPQRVSAVDGAALNIVSDRRISNRTKYNILHKTRRSHDEIDTAGAIGCSLSHYEVWKKFLETKADACLVLEDDAQIPVGLADMILGVSQPPPDFDIWSLSYRLYDPTLLPFPLDPHTHNKWKIPVNFWGTAAYIITRRGAERMMEGFFPIECHLDRYMSLKSILGGVKLVVNTDVKTYTLRQGTDIQLNNCALCNYPDTFDGFLIDKYEMRVGLACSIFVTILLALKIANVF
jgi:GR25 family glycosyltransferase involved in LPS biosynthesis